MVYIPVEVMKAVRSAAYAVVLRICRDNALTNTRIAFL